MESLTDIHILEVKSPSEFKAKIVLPWEQAAQEKAFRQLQVEMEEIERNTIINHDIHANEICALKDNRDDQWYRVRVEKVLYTRRGLQAKCYFMDTGESHMFALNRVFTLPEDYHSDHIPFQVRTFKLSDLQPITLTIEATDVGIQVPQRPTDHWDSSAHTYFNKLTAECDKAMVEVKGVDEKGKLLVVLYLLKDGHITNINDLLVEEEYACALSDSNLFDGSGHCEFADGVFEKTTPPHLSKGRARSSEWRQQHQTGSHTPSCLGAGPHSPNSDSAAVALSDPDSDDMMIAANEQLTDAGVKEFLAKLRNIREKKKCESDTEPLNKGRTRFRAEPVLGFRPASMNDNSGKLGVCEGLKTIQAASPAQRGVAPHRTPTAKDVRETWAQSDSECMRGVGRTAGGAHHAISGGSPDSDSSTASELRSIFRKKRSVGSHSKVNVSDTSAQAQRPLSASVDPVMGVQVACSKSRNVGDRLLAPKTGTTTLKAASYSGDAVSSPKTGAIALKDNIPAASRLSGPQPGTAVLKIVSSASNAVSGSTQSLSTSMTFNPITSVTYGRGRGQGLRKLMNKDILRIVEVVDSASGKTSPAVLSSMAQKSDTTEVPVTPEKEKNNNKPTAFADHNSSAFHTVKPHSGLNSGPSSEKLLLAKCQSQCQEELSTEHRKKQTGGRVASQADSLQPPDVGRGSNEQLMQHDTGPQSCCRAESEDPRRTLPTAHPVNSLNIHVSEMLQDFRSISSTPHKIHSSEKVEDSIRIVPTPHPINPREIDLNEMMEDSTRTLPTLSPINSREIDLIEMVEDSIRTSPIPRPVNPREIDLNEMTEDSTSTSSISHPINPRQIDLNEMTEDSTSTLPISHPINPREIDLNEMTEDSTSMSPTPHPINPREIDLNEMTEDSVKTSPTPRPINPREIDLNEMTEDSVKTSPTPRPINPREIDLNEMTEDSVKTSPTPRPINPREIDLNEMTDTDRVRSSDMRLLRQRDDSREQLLLNLLKSTSKDMDTEKAKLKVPLVWRPDRSMPNPLLGTITWGVHLPNPVFDVDEILFNSDVKSYMVNEGFKIPRAIQAYTWPALLRGRNIIGVTPRHSGKTTAYLPALVSELLKFPKYQKLPRGMGPKAIILVSSCKKADDIFHYVHCMIQKKTTLQALSIYGSEDHQVMPLLRGCDLLISTPHCLLRMLHSRYTQLDRLCHLVLDGAEVMIEEFTDEMREVMTLYAEKLKQYQGLPVPRQVMMFGYQWTPSMTAFQRAYQPDPVLVFSSRMEASVYGRVEQVVHMCLEKNHMTTLKNLVEELTMGSEQHRIVIVTTNNPNVARIDELMRSLSIYAQVIDSSAEISMIEERVSHWLDQGGPAVLVVTDNNVTELRVTSASTVIHFDIPDSQTKFGNRLALMLEFFQDSCAKHSDDQDKRRGQSHLLVTNMMLDHVQSLHSFLQRSSANIPTKMKCLLEGMQEGKNEDENRLLCPQLKQFGWCRYEVKCENRHLVLPCDVIQEDSPESWLPNSGMVKVRILKVLDTSHYYAMLLELQVPGQPRKDFQSLHTSLTMDLAMYLANENNQVPFVMEEDTILLAAVKDSEGVFHRARVLAVHHSSVKTGSRQVEVLYVDEGKKVTVRPDQLLKLPPKLQEIPPLAVEVYICRVKPVDGDTEWTRSSITYVSGLLKDKDLLGNVVLRMKNTLWLDPLAQQTRLKNVKTNIISLVVRPDLLKRGFAHDNPDHVKNLYVACEGKIPIDKKLYNKYLNIKPRQELQTETLNGDEEYHSVCVTVVDDPHHLFMQKMCNQKKLEHMQRELNKCMERMLSDGTILQPPTSKTSDAPTSQAASTTPTKGAAALPVDVSGMAESPEQSTAQSSRRSSCASSVMREMETSDIEQRFEEGCLCVAKFEDGSWSRAQVLQKLEDGWKVFFVDYGERVVVSDSNVHPLPDQFCKLPVQAIECGLGHVIPAGEEWSEASCDFVWNLSHTVNGDLKQLFAKVYDTQRAEVSGTAKYVVELYDTCTLKRDLHFSRELVWAHEATTDDETFMNLFDKVMFNPRRMYPDLDTKLTNMCAALYWAEENKMKYVTKLIANVVENLKTKACLDKAHDGLRSVVQLIGYLRSCDALSAILSALVKCVESNPKECAEIFGRKLVFQLVFCMEQVHRPTVQLQAMSAVLQLAKIEGFTPCMDETQLISVMAETLMSEDPSSEVLTLVCSFLIHMMTHGTQCAEECDSQNLGPVVFGIMAEINDPDMLEILLSLVATMTSLKKFQEFIMREKPIQQILNIMRERPSVMCVCHCAHICQLLCRAHRRNKRILLEAELVIIIKELLDSGVGSPLRELCEELNSSLVVKVPQQELAGLPVSAHGAGAAGEAAALVRPVIKWSQNSFRVLVTVQVQGATEDDFTITPNEIHLRCENGGQVYGFDYTLFGQVVLDKCRIMVHHAEVILSLAKYDKGMWSRLLQKKQKHANLLTDFDKLVDSSDSEVEEAENVTVLSRKKEMFPGVRKTEHVEYDFSYEEGSSTDSQDEIGSYSDDERFQNPSDMVDPMSVMDELIYMNAHKE